MSTGLYTAIDSLSGYIRLLDLEPRRAKQPDSQLTEESGLGKPEQLRGSLRTVNLDSKPEYTALSYVWGKDQTITHPILLDGLEFQATKNLVDALTHILTDDRPITLWVDAVCINQRDVAERSAQVSQMRRIYQLAHTTIVWLGTPADNSDIIMQFCREMGGTPSAKMMSNATLEQRQNLPALMGQLLQDNPQYMELMKQPALAELKEPLESLLSRPYWYRVWCLQEIAVSENSVITCGTMRSWPRGVLHGHECPGPDALRCDLSLIHQHQHFKHGSYPRKSGSMVSAAYRMLMQRGDYRRGMHGGSDRPATLLQLLFRSYVMEGFTDVSLQATLPIDHIYGLLGIAADAPELAIVPDYSKNWWDVYIDTSTALPPAGDTALFVMCQHGGESGGGDEGDAKLPSWVPDWRKSLRESPSLRTDMDRPFAACGTRSAIEWLPSLEPRIFLSEGGSCQLS